MTKDELRELRELVEQALLQPRAMIIPKFILANALVYLGGALGLWIGGLP